MFHTDNEDSNVFVHLDGGLPGLNHYNICEHWQGLLDFVILGSISSFVTKV